MDSEKIIHKTDNRTYDYSSWQNENRAEYDYVVNYVKQNSTVIDLGCGNGSLMQRLIKEKNAEVTGMEISFSGVETCRAKGLNVISAPIDEKLPFDDNSFDFAVCNVTLQMVMFPEMTLKEMKRISKNQIITFPNFAFYKNRLQLLFGGVMPTCQLFGYYWYNTGHIHQFSVKDFYKFINETGGLQVADHTFIKTGNMFIDFLMKLSPNLFQFISVFLLRKNDK